MNAHSSVVGGSSAERVLNCTGSVELAKTLPPPSGSSFANEGTALHEAMAAILEADYERDEDIIGVTFSNIEITEDLFHEGIVPALDFFDDLLKEFGDPEFEVECQVDFAGIDGAFGTCDIIMRAPDRTIVLDWKFGRGVPVSAVDNAQLKFYAYGGMMTEKTANLFGDDDSWPVELIIVQPRMEDGNSRWLTQRKQLKAFARDLRGAVERVGTPKETFNLGKWCRFCPAKAACPLMLGTVDKVLERNLEGLEDDLADWLKVTDHVEQWVDAVRAMAHERAEQGHSIPGYKLVAGRTTRHWINTEAAEKRLRQLGLKKADMYDSSFVSPAKAEKALKRVGKKLEKKDYDKHVGSSTSGTSLVPEDNPKPAIALPSQKLKEIGDRLGAR